MLQNRLCRDQNPDWLVLTPPCCPQASALPGAAHPWHTSWSSADVVTRRVLPFISYVHLVGLKYKAFVWSPKPDFLAIMFFKSADGGSEQNKRQSLGILLFLSALRGSVHHFQCSADSRWSYDVSFDGQYKKKQKTSETSWMCHGLCWFWPLALNRFLEKFPVSSVLGSLAGSSGLCMLGLFSFLSCEFFSALCSLCRTRARQLWAWRERVNQSLDSGFREPGPRECGSNEMELKGW